MSKRIIYVCEADVGFGSRGAMEVLRQSLSKDWQIELLTVGRGGTARAPALAAWRLLRSRCDLVHAWGPRCLRIASFARKPVLFTPAPLATAADARWLRAAAGRGRLRTCCLSGEDHRMLVEHAVPQESCELIRPGVRIGRPAAEREVVRKRLGLQAEDKAVLLLAEAGRWGDGRLGAQAVSILNGLEAKYRLLLCGAGAAHERLVDLSRRWSSTLVCEAAAAGFADAVAAADLAILTAEAAFPHVPVLACMAAGVPIVGTATRAVSELLEDHHTALLAPPKPKKLAQRLLQLAEDEPLRRKLSDAARAEAYELFSVSRFVAEMGQLYERDGGRVCE